jgi:hypothetical protein
LKPGQIRKPDGSRIRKPDTVRLSEGYCNLLSIKWSNLADHSKTGDFPLVFNGPNLSTNLDHFIQDKCFLLCIKWSSLADQLKT